MIPILLDTCAWIWLASDRKRLSPAATEAIEGAGRGERLHLSAISCWEVAKLVEKGRLAFKVPVREWLPRALALPGLQLEELSPEICLASTELPGEFHGDPADQILVATARHLGAALVTPDRRIRAYPHVPSLW